MNDSVKGSRIDARKFEDSPLYRLRIGGASKTKVRLVRQLRRGASTLR